jgi:hypothetical protein
MSFYAGTVNTAYQTTFNDIIKLDNNNYVVLATYSNTRRTGLWLFFLNEQGQLVDEWELAPNGDNKEGLMGTKLVALDGSAFLVLGNKKTYTNADDELYTTSAQIIYKYQYGNETKIWETEYSHPLHTINYAICGLELPDSCIVCGSAGDAHSTKTTVLSLNKADGTLTSAQSFGTASDVLRPFAAGADSSGSIYISGVATESGRSRAYILKLDPSYTEVWLKKYGGKYDNFLFDINITGNLLTAVGSGNDGAIINPAFYGWQGGSAWILKIDTGTGIVLKESFDETASVFNSIARLDDGGFAFAAIKNVNTTRPYWFNSYAVKVNEHLMF